MRTWSGIIALEDQPTGDGRLIEGGGLTWLDEPMPLRYVHEDSGMHQNAVTVGQIVTVTRQAGGVIFATGTLDDSFDEGAHAMNLVEKEMQNGVSIDPDDITVEYRTKDGGEIQDDTPYEDIVMVMTAARIRAATLVAIPAFAEAKITLDPVEEGEGDGADGELVEAAMSRVRSRWGSLTAAAAEAPSLSAFQNPNFSGPTKVRVEGNRLSGHLATWGTCHIGFSGTCVQPPVSHANYAYFATGTLMTAEGEEVHVGAITMDGPHAPRSLPARLASAHYDNTTTAVADVAIGEDEFGVWIAGVLRPGVTEEQARTLSASALSGDWRKLGGHLELVAALAVNVPGFPIVETSLAASGCPDVLIATGLVFSRDDHTPTPPAAGPSKGVLAGAAALAARIGRDPESRKAELVQRVKG